MHNTPSQCSLISLLALFLCHYTHYLPINSPLSHHRVVIDIQTQCLLNGYKEIEILLAGAENRALGLAGQIEILIGHLHNSIQILGGYCRKLHGGKRPVAVAVICSTLVISSRRNPGNRKVIMCVGDYSCNSETPSKGSKSMLLVAFVHSPFEP